MAIVNKVRNIITSTMPNIAFRVTWYAAYILYILCMLWITLDYQGP